MGWGNRWPERIPRPKAAKLPAEKLEQIHARASEFVKESYLLRELVTETELARGRLYLWNGPNDLMARITPLGPVSMLLELFLR